MLNRIQAAKDMDGRISSVAPSGAIAAVTSPMRAAFRDVNVKTDTPGPMPKTKTVTPLSTIKTTSPVSKTKMAPAGMLSPRVQKALTQSRNRKQQKSLDRQTPEMPAAAKRVSTKYLLTEQLPAVTPDALKATMDRVRKGHTQLPVHRRT